jgi:isopenicillin-N N-acyltransferase like protein
MSTRAIRQFNLSGNWLELGRQLGSAVGPDIKSFNDRYFSDAFNLLRLGSQALLEKYVRQMGEALAEYSPSAHEFLAGMAAGSGLSLDQVLMQSILPELTHVNSARDWPDVRGACTAACIAAGHNAVHAALIGQCWDFNIELPPWYIARLNPPLDAPRMLVVGMGSFFCCGGINSLGIATTFTASGYLPNVPLRIGVPLVAFFLEALGSEGYYEAMDTIVAPGKAGAYNILLTDGYTRNVLIEAAGHRVDLIEEEPILVCGNHFQHPGMVQATGQDLDPPEPPAREFARSTVARAQRLRVLLDQVPPNRRGVEYLKTCLKDHENHPLSVCAHPESTILHFQTLGAMILEPAMRTIHFCPGPPCRQTFASFTL